MSSRRPLTSSAADDFSDSDKDSIDLHIAKRHAHLEKLAKGSDSESDEHSGAHGNVVEREVYNIELSDSDDDEVLPEPSAANIADGSDDGEGEGNDGDDDDGDWGGRRRKYYGVDTDEFEIMEDDERKEALQEEEEEAVRLQKKQLAGLHASDYLDDDDVDDSDEVDDLDDAGNAETDSKSVASALEVSALARELEKYYMLIRVWKGRQKWNPVANTRFHLYAAYVSNIAFYFALLTDPDSSSIDVREHPVVKRILELRKLIVEHEVIEIAKPTRPVIARSAKQTLVESENVEPSNQKAKGMPETPGNVQQRREGTLEKSKHQNGRGTGSGGHDSAKGKGNMRKNERIGKKGDASSRNRGMVKDPSRNADDTSLVKSLLRRPAATASSDELARDDDAVRKQRTLNRMTGSLDSQAKNYAKRRVVSADMDHVQKPSELNRLTAQEVLPGTDNSLTEQNELEGLGDNEFVEHMLQKKEKKNGPKKRKEPDAPHVYTFKDSVDVGERRRASTQVVLNRGLTRYRPKEKKTPRTKNKLAYAKAVKRRKGMVRDAVAVKPGVSYGGEASGININARRGANLV
eukprot:IDg7707t1